MNSSGETKLLLILGLIVLFGAGALIFMKGIGEKTADPRPTPTPVVMDAAKYDSIVSAAKHTKGAPNAEVTVIEFADFECKSCRRAYAGSLSKTVKDPKRPIKLVFKHFPLESHQFALPAATAVEAADKQGKFWEMYDTLFTGVDEVINEDFIRNAAKKAGLNMEQFEKDWKSEDVRKIVEQGRQEAISLGINFTPTFIVKDKTGKIESVVGGDELEDLMAFLFEGTPRKPKPQLAPPGATMPAADAPQVDEHGHAPGTAH